MVDVVFNHAGIVDYKNIIPFNKEEYYHSKCNIDYNN
jgi:hypothetical protein